MNGLVIAGYTLGAWALGVLYGTFLFERRNQNRTLLEIVRGQYLRIRFLQGFLLDQNLDSDHPILPIEHERSKRERSSN